MSERLLLVAPTPRDAELSRGILADAGLSGHVCVDLDELCREVDQGVGAVLLTDETLGHGDPERLAAALRNQPTWSDIPVILLSPRGADSPTAVWAMNAFSNLTVLDQPIRVMTLVSALRTAVAARVRQYELRDRLEALRRSDRQKDEFLATLSHELRNPLAPIRNALHVLRLAGADPDTRARVMDTMERQVAAVIRLVDDLLELSRINQGRIELRKERVKLASVLRSALESSAPLIEAAGHNLSVSEPRETVLLDAQRRAGAGQRVHRASARARRSAQRSSRGRAHSAIGAAQDWSAELPDSGGGRPPRFRRQPGDLAAVARARGAGGIRRTGRSRGSGRRWRCWISDFREWTGPRSRSGCGANRASSMSSLWR